MHLCAKNYHCNQLVKGISVKIWDSNLIHCFFQRMVSMSGYLIYNVKSLMM